MAEKFWYLKDCRLFERLSVEQLRELELHSRIRRFPKGSPVYLPTDASNCVLLVAQGQVKICNLMHDGRQSILCFVNPGEVFGELALFGARNEDEYAETTETSLIVIIPASIMHQLLSASPELSLSISRLVGLRRRHIERRLKNLLFQSNRERLIRLLLELAEDYGRRVPTDQVELAIRLSHQDLASIIGSTRESVTLLLGDLQQEGLVQLQRRRITIRSVPRLVNALESVPDSSPDHSVSAKAGPS